MSEVNSMSESSLSVGSHIASTYKAIELTSVKKMIAPEHTEKTNTILLHLAGVPKTNSQAEQTAKNKKVCTEKITRDLTSSAVARQQK